MARDHLNLPCQPVKLTGRIPVTIADDRAEDHSDEPPPQNNSAKIAAAVVTAGAVVATQLLWPWTHPAIHDGVLLGIILLAGIRRI